MRIEVWARPDMTVDKLKAMRKEYTSEARFRKEVLIEYEALSGSRVYPEWDESIHVIPDHKIPRYGTRYMALDPHPRTPHACLWILIDEWSDWYVYREMWPSIVYGDPRQPGREEEDNIFTVRDYADTIARLEGASIEWRNSETDDEYGIYREVIGGERIVYRFMDQAGKAFQASDEAHLRETYARRYDRFGLQFRDPKKSHQVGEDAVHELLAPRHHDLRGQWPRVHVAESCAELRLEMGRYRYENRGGGLERELSQKSAQVRCHLIDCLRYLATADLAWIHTLQSPQALRVF